MKELMKRLKNLADFTSSSIETEFKSYLQDNELAMGRLLPAFRVSLTGLGTGPSLYDIAELLGKEEVTNRIQTALKTIK